MTDWLATLFRGVSGKGKVGISRGDKRNESKCLEQHLINQTTVRCEEAICWDSGEIRRISSDKENAVLGIDQVLRLTDGYEIATDA
jgi:hypothetical protein